MGGKIQAVALLFPKPYLNVDFSVQLRCIVDDKQCSVIDIKGKDLENLEFSFVGVNRGRIQFTKNEHTAELTLELGKLDECLVRNGVKAFQNQCHYFDLRGGNECERDSYIEEWFSEFHCKW